MKKPNHRSGFSDKHGPDAAVDPAVKKALAENAVRGQLPCAVAFKVAAQCDRSPGEIGKTADLLELRLVKCQLGLFGYGKQNKIVKSQAPDPALATAITGASENGRIACRDLWVLARRTGTRKLRLSKACEAMGIKIRHCQLGAF